MLTKFYLLILLFTRDMFKNEFKILFSFVAMAQAMTVMWRERKTWIIRIKFISTQSEKNVVSSPICKKKKKK